MTKMELLFSKQVLAALDNLDREGRDDDDNDFDCFWTIVRAWEQLRGRAMRKEQLGDE